MSRSAGGFDLDALATLLGSARDLMGELAKGSTQRALRALAAIPPDERAAVTIALERAAETWRQNEAFRHAHQVRVRANPHAQLFVRVFDDVEELSPQEFDLLPESLRVMRRLGASMRPELRAVWEPAVTTARDMLTPAELDDCVKFLRLALSLVTAVPADQPAVGDESSAEMGQPDGPPARSKAPKRSRGRQSSR